MNSLWITNITNFHWDFSKSHLIYAPTLVLIKVLGAQNSFLALRLTSVIFSLLAGITVPKGGEAANSRLQGQFDESIMDQPAQTIDLPESFGTEPAEGGEE